ncbi:Na+/H+ antiporter NhaC [Kurthia huakuii]|jgi:NhaC family Na+:H+ antiporter|uniref:Na+/H+ antiporter NhaC n=1 Tax=Kurthia huakuii TaxID=1421019 RepID=UPI0004974886|nr:Na+/H+ antiporter NhaC [Kurthia huakuii]
MREKREPTVGIALIPIITMVIVLFVGIFVYGADPHIPIMISAVVASLVALYLGFSWRELEQGIVKGISLSLQALLILIILGTLISTWLAAGIVPTMIYYGVEFLSQGLFLPLAIVICSVVAVASGNAWTAAGTIGIAVMGIGTVFGYNPAMVAGAVISGCYFGDKLSPLSETTNMSPGITGVELFDHIRNMMFTTLPAWVISIVLFFFLGWTQNSKGGSADTIATLQHDLNNLFTISPWLLLVPVVVLVLIALKMPAIPGLLIGSILGLVMAVTVQGASIKEVLAMMVSGYTQESNNEIISNLLNNGGIEAMMYTVSLVMLAMSLGGILESTGILETLVASLLKFAKSTGSLIATTVVTCISANVIACDQYLSILLPGRMYLSAYKKRGLHPKALSRTIEDAGTMTSPLVPWNTCGAFMAATLGVATIQYAPYAFLCIISPIIAVIFGFFDIKIAKLDNYDEIHAHDDEEPPEEKQQNPYALNNKVDFD